MFKKKFVPNFNPTTSVEPEKPKYDHGFSPEEVEELEKQYTILDRRDKTKQPLTLEEFKIVVSICRIRRNSIFLLQKEKPIKAPKVKKEKVVKEKVIKEKVIKPKKKTKKELAIEHSKMMTLLFARNSGKVLSDEEDKWLDNKLEEFENES